MREVHSLIEETKQVIDAEDDISDDENDQQVTDNQQVDEDQRINTQELV